MISSTRYAVVRTLGSGAMGKVFLAQDRELGRTVALKVITPSLAGHPQVTARFEREARLQSRVRHPNLVGLLDFHRDGEEVWMAMECIEGESLERVLEVRRLSPEEVVALAHQVGGALDALHGVGVVHRDLKPANVMRRERDGSFVLMDLGLAVDGTGTVLTETGEILGTPLYLPPETLTGTKATAASDQWQFAAILFECLAGRRLITATSLEEIGRSLATGGYFKALSEASRVPEALRAPLARALALAPERRFPDCAGLASALAGAAGGSDPAGPGGPPVGEFQAGTGQAAWADAGTPQAVPTSGPRSGSGFGSATGASVGVGPGPGAAAPRDEAARRLALRSSGLALVLLFASAFLWGPGATPPREIRWEVVGDLLRVSFEGEETFPWLVFGEDPEASDRPDGPGSQPDFRPRDGGSPPGKRWVAGLPPDREVVVRLRWKGGQSQPFRARAEPLAVPRRLGPGPGRRVRVEVLRACQVGWSTRGYREAEPGSLVLDPPPPAQDPAVLEFVDRGAVFQHRIPLAEFPWMQIEFLTTALGAAEGSPAARLARTTLAEAGSRVAELLVEREVPEETRRDLWNRLQAWSTARIRDRARRGGDDPPSTPEGSPGSRHPAPSWDGGPVLRPELSVIGSPDALTDRGIRFGDPVGARISGGGFSRAAVAATFPWPGIPESVDSVQLALLVHRQKTDSVFQVRSASGRLAVDLWVPGDHLDKEAEYRGPIALVLPRMVIPSPGEDVRIELQPVGDQVLATVRLNGVQILLPPPEGAPPGFTRSPIPIGSG